MTPSVSTPTVVATATIVELPTWRQKVSPPSTSV
jgi:hypothetical protein